MYDDLTRVIDEARLTIHRTVSAIEVIHGASVVSVPMRAVLEYLRREGPHTVSSVARARSVSRQHIQMLVNESLGHGLVQRIDNPDHVRAPLIGLTTQGVTVIDEMYARERAVIEPLTAGRPSLTSERLRSATEVLAAIGAAMTECGEL